MRILFVCYLYYPDITGGAARSVQTLAEALARQGHDIHIARVSQKPKAPEVINGVIVHYLPLRNIYWPYDGQKRSGWKRILWHVIDAINPLAMLDFSKLIKQIKPDVVNSSIIAGFSTGIFYVCRWHKIKLVHTMRDYYLMCPQVAMYKNGKNCNGICDSCKPFACARRHALKNADLVLSNSDFVANRHAEQCMFKPGQPVKTLYNINLFPVAEKPRQIANGKPLRFGFIGKLSETKGPESLLEAAGYLPPKGWTLAVAGSGDAAYVQKLKSTYTHPNINYIGWADAKEFYKQIDVLVCPSRFHDPLPRVVFEAYANGIPVIVANTGGLPECVNDGQTGLIINPFNTREITDAMLKFLNGEVDYNAFSRACLTMAEQWSEASVIKSYENHLNEMMRA